MPVQISNDLRDNGSLAASPARGTARKPVYVNAEANDWRSNSGNEVSRDLAVESNCPTPMKTTEDLVKYLGKELPKYLPDGVKYLVVIWDPETTRVEAASNANPEEVIDVASGFKEAYITGKLHDEYNDN